MKPGLTAARGYQFAVRRPLVFVTSVIGATELDVLYFEFDQPSV